MRKVMSVLLVVTILLIFQGCADPVTKTNKHVKNAREAVKSGSFDKAIEEYNKALLLSPNHPAALKGIVDACEKKGDYAGAIEAQKKYMEAVPDPELALKLAELYLAKEDAKSALEILQKELLVSPDSPRVNRMMGEAYLKNKNSGDALRYLLLSLLYDSTCGFNLQRAEKEQDYFFLFKYIPIGYKKFNDEETDGKALDKVKSLILEGTKSEERGSEESKTSIPTDLFADKMIVPGEKIGSYKLGDKFEAVKEDYEKGMPLPFIKETLYAHKRFKIMAIVGEDGAITQISSMDMRFMTDKKIVAQNTTLQDVMKTYGSNFELLPHPPVEVASFKLAYPDAGIGFSIVGNKVTDIYVRKSLPAAEIK